MAKKASSLSIDSMETVATYEAGYSKSAKISTVRLNAFPFYCICSFGPLLSLASDFLLKNHYFAVIFQNSVYEHTFILFHHAALYGGQISANIFGFLFFLLVSKLILIYYAVLHLIIARGFQKEYTTKNKIIYSSSCSFVYQDLLSHF
jgi:hypothetical protein